MRTVTGQASASHRECVQSVLQRKTPARIVYGPYYWQRFAHHLHHELLLIGNVFQADSFSGRCAGELLRRACG